MEKKQPHSGKMKNSYIYECVVMHDRVVPKRNQFRYNMFMFSLDLDEIDELVRHNILISRNRFNVFSFQDKDHLFVEGNGDIKNQIMMYLAHHFVDTGSIKRIQLITNLRTMGYQFNPVSFYFCFNGEEQPVCAVAEVCNTFGEMKLYLLDSSTLSANIFDRQVQKNFYVSPFIDLDTMFHFRLSIPGERLSITINDHKDGKSFFFSSLVGTRTALTQASTLWFTVRFPFITLQVITLIYWQAIKLWIKKIKWHRKEANIGLQQGVLRPHKSITQ
jgi:DUF1365 family protein